MQPVNKRTAESKTSAAQTISEHLNRRTVRLFMIFTVLSLLLCRLICILLIPRCEPAMIMHPCYQEHLAQRLKTHHDCHMVFRLITEFRNDQSLFVGFAGTAVGNKQKICFVAGTSCATRERLFPSDLARPMALSFSADMPPRH